MDPGRLHSAYAECRKCRNPPFQLFFLNEIPFDCGADVHSSSMRPPLLMCFDAIDEIVSSIEIPLPHPDFRQKMSVRVELKAL